MRGPSFIRLLTVLTGAAVVLGSSAASATEPQRLFTNVSAETLRAIAPPSVAAEAPLEATDPSDPSDPSAELDLGELPPELAELRWPELPRTTREVTVTSADALAAEAAVPGTRIVAEGVVGGDLTIGADDIEIVADAATSLGVLHIPQRRARVRIEGGQWRGVRVAIPATFQGAADFRPEYMAEDLFFDGVTIDSGTETAMEVRGKRIALVRSEVHGGRYSVWCGDTGHFQSEDLIILGNVLDSAGPEPTVRIVSVLRSAVVSNVLTNTYKHNYRIHGESDLNYASDNLLVNTGVMFGRMAGDSLGRVWFDDNVFHHVAPDLFNPDMSIRELRARRNLVHVDGRAGMYEGAPQPGWDISDNVVVPYAPPPAQ